MMSAHLNNLLDADRKEHIAALAKADMIHYGAMTFEHSVSVDDRLAAPLTFRIHTPHVDIPIITASH